MSSVPTYDKYEEPTAELTMDMVGENTTAPSPQHTAPAPATAQTTTRPAPAPPVIAVGQVLGRRYQLTEQIGRGGSSLVFRATDLDAGPEEPRVLAVKTPDPGRPRTRSAERLRHEFTLARSLRHPAIVRVFDFDGGGAESAPFFTMELLEGRSLSSAMREAGDAALPGDQVKSVLSATGNALLYAHQQGIVHGDFKPANVFLSRDGIRVLDFGNAASGDGKQTGDPRAATTCYASPELLLGQRPQPPDDVFSFACVAYELLSGRHPFDRQSALDARAARLLPVRPWSLREAQWQSLDAALGFSREPRPALDALLASLLADPPKASSPPVLLQKVPARIALRALPAAQAERPPRATSIPEAIAPRLREHSRGGQAPVHAGARMPSSTPSPAEPHLPANAPTLSKSTRDFIASTLATAALLMTLVIVVTEWNSYPALKNDVSSAIASFLRREPQVEPPSGRPTTASLISADRADMSSVSPDGDADSSGNTPLVVRPPGTTTLDAGQRPAGPRTSRTPATPPSPRAAAPQRSGTSAAATYLAFPESAVTVGERTSAVALTVRRSGSLAGRSSIRWRAASGSARAGQDFTASSGVVSFPEGHDLRVIYIPIINDTVAENTEQFTVELLEPDAASLAGPVARVTVTITDDD